VSQGKVLVADDEEDILETVADRLVFMGFEVQKARDGAECLATIEQEVPDLVLLDLRMPRMDGMEVLSRLRETHPGLPVVVLSASSERAVADGVLSQGAVGYLLKPFPPALLMEQVYRALNREPA
jgi:CheY-like chemotaxis protein